MGLLDDIKKERFKPKQKKYRTHDNFTELQNDGMEEVTEDFGDSPHANRVEYVGIDEDLSKDEICPICRREWDKCKCPI